jgi:hypothetical protein
MIHLTLIPPWRKGTAEIDENPRINLENDTSIKGETNN